MDHIATYRTDWMPEFALGNPFCEALPPIPDQSKFISALLRMPRGTFNQRGRSDVGRFLEASTLLDINLPREESYLLAMRCVSMLLNTFSRNHPLSIETTRRLYSIDSQFFSNASALPLQVDAFSVLGWSGMGKTTLIRSVLELFPQVIQHSHYAGREFSRKQVVYLSVDAPVSGSPKGLILNIASALDRALGLSGTGSYVSQFYQSRASIETQRVLITRALATSGLGLLHVDDLQRLAEGSRSQRDAVSAMITGIANSAGCSLLFSGTIDALTVLQSTFEVARRSSRRGSIILEPPSDENSPFFFALVKFLFKFQLVEQPTVPTEELCKHLLRTTAGIPGVLVMLYVATQETSIASSRSLTKELFNEVMRDQFGALIAPLRKLNAARKRGSKIWSSDLDRELKDALDRNGTQAPLSYSESAEARP